MVELIVIHDLVNPETGKTYREENLELKHNIPVGALVEVQWDAWFGDGACWKVHARLWVVGHNRDCDGTPLYSLSRWRDPDFALHFAIGSSHHGFGEEDLTVIKITDAIKEGYNALEWAAPSRAAKAAGGGAI